MTIYYQKIAIPKNFSCNYSSKPTLVVTNLPSTIHFESPSIIESLNSENTSEILIPSKNQII